MTALAIDPSEIKITDHRTVRRRLWGAPEGLTMERVRQAALNVDRRQRLLESIERSLELRASKLDKREASVSEREKTLRFALGKVRHAPPSLRGILHIVASRWDQPVQALLSIRRAKNLVSARRAFCLLARELTGRSYPQIGKFLGGRDHTTVLHACRGAEEILQPIRGSMAQDATLLDWVEAIHASLEGRA